MKYVIHFIGGKEMIVNNNFVDDLLDRDSSDFRLFAESIEGGNVVNINNITHIEKQDEEGYF
jgi:hypothetical protein